MEQRIAALVGRWGPHHALGSSVYTRAGRLLFYLRGTVRRRCCGKSKNKGNALDCITNSRAPVHAGVPSGTCGGAPRSRPRMKALGFIVGWALAGVGGATLLAIALGTSGLAPQASARLAAWLAPPGPAAPGYASAVARAAPAVVSVNAVTRRPAAANPLTEDPLFRRFFGNPSTRGRIRAETSLGSGVIIARDGVLLTNYHVIRGSDAVRVILADGRMADADVVGIDPESDLAVLRIVLENLPQIELADSSAVRVGEIVLAIGNPFGIGQTVTLGIVSATGRNRIGINTYENFIQTDAAINVGNSGGALIDTRGALVGINAARLETDGIGFAIPTGIALDVAREILATGGVQRGWFGIDARDLTDGLRAMLDVEEGILVEAVVNGGPADTAGVRPGDVITHIESRAVPDSRAASAAIAALAPGTQAHVRGVRDGSGYDTEITVSRRPPRR